MCVGMHDSCDVRVHACESLYTVKDMLCGKCMYLVCE